MFVCSLALGKQEVLKVAANNKQGPSKGFHSILGQAGKHDEYIIERWGQAKPIFLITYRWTILFDQIMCLLKYWNINIKLNAILYHYLN